MTQLPLMVFYETSKAQVFFSISFRNHFSFLSFDLSYSKLIVLETFGLEIPPFDF